MSTNESVVMPLEAEFKENDLERREMTDQTFVLTDTWKEEFYNIHNHLTESDLKFIEEFIIEHFSKGTILFRSLSEPNSCKIMGPWELSCLAQAIHALRVIKSVYEQSKRENPMPPLPSTPPATPL